MVLCKAGCLKFDKHPRITKKNVSLKIRKRNSSKGMLRLLPIKNKPIDLVIGKMHKFWTKLSRVLLILALAELDQRAKKI